MMWIVIILLILIGAEVERIADKLIGDEEEPSEEEKQRIQRMKDLMNNKKRGRK